MTAEEVSRRVWGFTHSRGTLRNGMDGVLQILGHRRCRLCFPNCTRVVLHHSRARLQIFDRHIPQTLLRRTRHDQRDRGGNSRYCRSRPPKR